MALQLVILGGGHAGGSAALGAAKHLHDLGKQQDVQITLIDQSPYLTVRPRLYEYELEQTQVSLREYLQPVGVEVVTARVTSIDSQQQYIAYENNGASKTQHFDALVVALGSQLAHPSIDGIDLAYDIDTYASAKRFREALSDFLKTHQQAARIAILGGGITGLELATELPVTVAKMAQDAGVDYLAPQVFLLDRHCSVSNAGEELIEPVSQALAMANVTCIDHVSVDAVSSECVFYNAGEQLHVDFVVSTLGMRANPLAKQLLGSLDNLGRIKVNSYLQLDQSPRCFCAGDMACSKPDANHDSVMSCQQGRPQGRYAGYNAIAWLLNQPLQIYSQPNYVTCIDLGDYGAVYTQGWDRQLVLSGNEAKIIKQHINQDRIYPPKSGKVADILDAGTLDFVTPTDSV